MESLVDVAMVAIRWTIEGWKNRKEVWRNTDIGPAVS